MPVPTGLALRSSIAHVVWSEGVPEGFNGIDGGDSGEDDDDSSVRNDRRMFESFHTLLARMRCCPAGAPLSCTARR